MIGPSAPNGPPVPIEIAEELDEAGLERARHLVEKRMVEMVREADHRLGHEILVSAVAADTAASAERVAGG